MSIDPTAEPVSLGTVTAKGSLGTVVPGKKINPFLFTVPPSGDDYIARIGHKAYFHFHRSLPLETVKERKEQLEWLYPFADTRFHLGHDSFDASIERGKGETLQILHQFPEEYAKGLFAHWFNRDRGEKVLPEERRTDGELEVFTAEGMVDPPPCCRTAVPMPA